MNANFRGGENRPAERRIGDYGMAAIGNHACEHWEHWGQWNPMAAKGKWEVRRSHSHMVTQSHSHVHPGGWSLAPDGGGLS